MLNDIGRNTAYKAAIESYIADCGSPNLTVLDVGAGTGLLGLYAAGAGRVIAVEQDETMFNICRRVTRALAHLSVVRCSSYDYDIAGSNTDLVVTETLDSVGVGEGVVGLCHDLATRSPRHLTFIPESVTLLGFPVQSQLLHEGSFSGNYRTSVGAGTRAGTGAGAGAGESYCCEFMSEYPDVVKLSKPASILSVTLGHKLDHHVRLIEFRVTRSGWCDGICSFFKAKLYKDNVITSAPDMVKTSHTRVDCWEQGYHPLPRRRVTIGDIIRVKSEVSDISVKLSWLQDTESVSHTPLQPSQIKLLNSNFTKSKLNELINVVPKIVTTSGILLSNPLKHHLVKQFSVQGYVVNSAKLRSWCQVLPPALLCPQSPELAAQVNTFSTLLHEGVPWDTLPHVKLSNLVEVAFGSGSPTSRTVEFTALAPQGPTAFIYWLKLTLRSGVTFSAAREPLWRPAAVVLQTERSVGYQLEVAVRGRSLTARLKPSLVPNYR